MSGARVVKRGAGYTAVPNEFLRNAALSGDARMLFQLLYSHSEDWVFRREQIAKNLRYGRDRMTSAIRELEAGGYLSRSRPTGDNGELIPGPWNWTLDLTPARPTGFRRDGEPSGRETVGTETSTPLEEQGEEYQGQEDQAVATAREARGRMDVLDAVVEAAGELVPDTARVAMPIAPIIALLGADPPCDLDLDVLPAIRAVRARAGPPPRIRSWKYFRQAILDLRDQRLEPTPEPKDRTRDQPARNSRPQSAHARATAVRRAAMLDVLDEMGSDAADAA